MHVRARKGIGVPAAGAVDLPRPDGRAEHPGDSRNHGPRCGGAAGAAAGAARGTEPDAAGAGARPTRCRAASGGARRSRERSSFRRNSSCSTSRSPASIRSRSTDIQKIIFHLQRPRHRRPHHRPQRARDAAHHRPRLHRARRRASSRAARPTVWPPTKRSGGFIWGPSSGWTKIRPGNCIELMVAAIQPRSAAATLDHELSCYQANDLADAYGDHGHPAETPHQARSEADPDAVAAAGDQAAADVDARAVRPSEPGDGREPDARGGADRGPAAGRGCRGRRRSRTPSSRPTRPTPGTTRTTSTSSATTSTTATGRARRRRSRSSRRSRTRCRRPARCPIT